MRIPDAFEPVVAVGARGFARPEARAWVARALTRWGTLSRAAAHAEDVVEMQGRGIVRAVPAPGGGRWVVRRYRRGGWAAPLLGDRYLKSGAPRPLREAVASEAARARGIATPRVVAGVAYAAGAFYRADLVTELVPGSVDLARLLFDERDGPDEPSDPAAATLRARALGGAGASIVRLAEAGVRHPDVNARNLLVQLDEGDPSPRVWVLDLDRAAVGRPGSVDAGRMGARLERSLRKLEREKDHALGAAEWEALARGLGRRGAP